jgi:EAL domain-containing protein (putative c-di-GMP-specific phosphodiesterase class I)
MLIQSGAAFETRLPVPPGGAFLSRRQQVADRRRTERELRRAVDAREFVLHYEGRHDLSSGALTAVEGHIAWMHRRRGLIASSTLREFAGEAGLIAPLCGWMLGEACAAAAIWPGDAIMVSVGVSARQVAGGMLPEQVADALERSGLHPERLELRLTEAALTGCGVETLLMLSAIRDLGIGLALDDFGAGLASLSLLKRLPLTAIKLDCSLVRNLPKDRENASIVRAAVGMGHALGSAVVADGIETEQQRAFLLSAGCEEGQGPLFGPVMPSDQLRALLRRL